MPLNQPVNYRKANPLIFGVRQKLPFFGKLGLKGEMAGQEVRMVEEELRAKEQEIIAKVKSAYADYFMASKSVEIYKELLESGSLHQHDRRGIVPGRQSPTARCHQGAAGAHRTFE